MSYNGVTAETDNDICKLWSNYFSDLYTPSNDAAFDKSFYDTVSSKVKDYSEAGIEPCSVTNPNCRGSGKVIPILFNILVIRDRTTFS
jgi:hypothetical protein